MEVVEKWTTFSHNFALILPQIQKLRFEEQKNILMENSRLYAHYLLANFLISNTRQTQLNWIFAAILAEKKCPYDWIHVDFDILNRYQFLVENSTDIEKFKDNLEAFKKFKIPFKQNSLVAFVLLFSGFAQDLVEEVTKILKIEFSIEDLTSNLRQFTDLIKFHWTPQLKELSFKCKELDDFMMKNQVETWKKIWNENAPDNDFVEKMISLRMGAVHLRPKLHQEGQSLLKNRVYKIVQNLGADNSAQLQVLILHNHPKVALLQLIKICTSPDFLQQIRLLCGNEHEMLQNMPDYISGMEPANIKVIEK